MDKCEKCGEVTNNTYLLYPAKEYPKKDNRLVVCGGCIPDNVIRVSPVSYELVEQEREG